VTAAKRTERGDRCKIAIARVIKLSRVVVRRRRVSTPRWTRCAAVAPPQLEASLGGTGVSASTLTRMAQGRDPMSMGWLLWPHGRHRCRRLRAIRRQTIARTQKRSPRSRPSFAATALFTNRLQPRSTKSLKPHTDNCKHRSNETTDGIETGIQGRGQLDADEVRGELGLGYLDPLDPSVTSPQPVQAAAFTRERHSVTVSII